MLVKHRDYLIFKFSLFDVQEQKKTLADDNLDLNTLSTSKNLARSMKLFEVRELYDNEEDANSGTGKPLKRWVYEVDITRKCNTDLDKGR